MNPHVVRFETGKIIPTHVWCQAKKRFNIRRSTCPYPLSLDLPNAFGYTDPVTGRGVTYAFVQGPFPSPSL